MDKERIFFLNFERMPVHDGDEWVGIAIGLEELKAKYKKTLEEVRMGGIYYDVVESQLKVYEYKEEDFYSYPIKDLLE